MRVTSTLSELLVQKQVVQLKRSGRPRGAKDRQPRSKDRKFKEERIAKCPCADDPFESNGSDDPLLITSKTIKLEVSDLVCADNIYVIISECEQKSPSHSEASDIQEINQFYDDWIT